MSGSKDKHVEFETHETQIVIATTDCNDRHSTCATDANSACATTDAQLLQQLKLNFCNK